MPRIYQYPPGRNQAMAQLGGPGGNLVKKVTKNMQGVTPNSIMSTAKKYVMSKRNEAKVAAALSKSKSN